uniref:Uncharacterized protein n=1 Tax=Arundo donax TaxID=35708 RepID=A0A0A9AB90_ARUDO
MCHSNCRIRWPRSTTLRVLNQS